MKHRWFPVLILLIASFIPFAKIIFTGQQLGPTEHLQTMLTADAPAPEYGWDILQADGLLQFWPWRDAVFESWRRFEVPWVNPYQLSGQPLAANSQSGAFYPLHFLFALLPGSTAFKIVILAFLHAFIGACGVYLWSRHLGASKHGATIAGVLLATSQFIAAWSPLASVTTTVAWIPWILAGIAHPSRSKGFVTSAMATAMLLTSGHLQFAAYGMMAAVLFGIVELIRSRAYVPALGVMVGLLLAYPMVKPTLEFSKLSHRRNTPTAEGYQAYIGSALTPYEALSAVHPKLLGDASGTKKQLNEQLSVGGYWPMFVKQSSNPAECALWIAPIALVLVPLAFARKKQFAWIGPVLLALVGAILCFGGFLNQLLYFNFPGWSATGSPGRALILLVLGCLPLVAFGFDKLEESETDNKKWLLLALVPLLALGIGFNGMNMAGSSLKMGSDNLSPLVDLFTKPHLPVVALTALFGAVVTGLVINKKTRLIGIALTPLFGLVNSPLAGKPIEFPTTKINKERILFISKNWNMFATPNAYMPPNLATLTKQYDLFGYDSIQDVNYVNFLKQVTGKEPAPPENGNMMLFRGSVDKPEPLNAAGVAWTTSNPTDLEIYKAAVSRVVPNRGSASISEDRFSHQIITLTADATEVLIRDRYYDWITSSTSGVTVEGKEGFRLVKCKPGTREIRLEYGSSAYRFAPLLMLILLATSLVILLRNESNPARTES